MGATAGGSEPASARAVAVLERAAEAGAVAATLAEAAVGVLSDVCGLVGWPVGHLLVTTSPGVLTPTA
ncbi:MAG: hypothetical protein QOJ69_400, partial [Actinomycetota bacterium]|nr:hypothetical protein [Actinomycetota bacterium]